MRPVLTEVVSDSEFDEILEVHYKAFQFEDVIGLWNLLYPELGPGPDSHAAAIADGVAKTVHIHRSDPCSRWIKVTDADTGCVVGAARWVIATENPFKGALAIDSQQWPDGEQRAFANICVRQIRGPRYEEMQRPHVFLNVCFTHPEYWRKGIGRMLMDWGLKQADSLGLDTYVNASEGGRPLYAAYGFDVVGHHRFDATKADPSPLWRRMEDMILPFEWVGMLRSPKRDA